MKKIVCLILALTFVCALLAACAKAPEVPADGTENPATGSKTSASLWDDAALTADTTVGEGNKTVTLAVIAEGKTVTVTVKTDAETLGDALLSAGLIDGEQGPYGLYVKKVLGMTADYDVDGHYWSLTKGGDYCMTGADATPIADGEKYEFTYEK